MQDPDVVALKARVRIIADPELSRILPERHAVLEVDTKDGRKIRKRVTTFRGKSDNPLSTEEIEKKAGDLIEPVLGVQRSRRLLDAVGRLESLPSVRELLPLLQA